jgi:hypothetical protein
MDKIVEGQKAHQLDFEIEKRSVRGLSQDPKKGLNDENASSGVCSGSGSSVMGSNGSVDMHPNDNDDDLDDYEQEDDEMADMIFESETEASDDMQLENEVSFNTSFFQIWSHRIEQF